MSGKKALVIDDEQVVLESVSRILKGQGYVVHTSLRGRDGLAMGLVGPYDVVLTDIRMPDIGGMKVLREIKRHRPTLPVVMITGYATVRSAVQAMKLGAEEYLEKPFTPEGLVAAVERAMKKVVSEPAEDQDVLHKDEILSVLDRAATDAGFVRDLFYQGVDALDAYQLTGPEKLALLTGDIAWIEKQVGPLTQSQKIWLERRLEAEIW